MSTPKPGQIRCPTCHRSTPPAAFCTQCGSPIPASSIARPRGMDRDELDARIRQRRGPETPYRRGGLTDDWSGDASAYAPFEPEAEDALAVREDAATPEAPRIDLVDDSYEPVVRGDPVGEGDASVGWAARDEIAAPSGASSTPPPEQAAPAPDPWRRGREADEGAAGGPGSDAIPAAAAARYDDRAYDDDAGTYGADEAAWDDAAYAASQDDEPRRGGGLALVAFLGLGALALLVGAFLSGIFNSNGVANASATPSATVAVSATPEPTAAGTASATGGASGSANSSEGPPITFPDGFVAQTQACATEPNGSGCNSDGATNDGSIWVWIGFEKGQRTDVIGMTILDASGAIAAQASLELSQVGCRASGACNGWVLFPGFGKPFTGLDPGDYRIRINRNGLPAAEAAFTVS